MKHILITEKGRKLHCRLYLKNKNSLTVVMCHGFLSRSRDLLLYQRTLARKYNVFTFDFSGHGRSSGKIEDLSVNEMITDLRAVIKHVKKLSSGKIILFGHSLGGLICLCCANADTNGLILINPVVDFENVMKILLRKKSLEYWEKESYATFRPVLKYPKSKVGKRFLLEGRKIDMDKIVNRVKCPALIIQGDKDTITKARLARKLYRWLSCPKEYFRIKNGSHWVLNPFHVMRINKKIDSWLKGIINTKINKKIKNPIPPRSGV